MHRRAVLAAQTWRLRTTPPHAKHAMDSESDLAGVEVEEGEVEVIELRAEDEEDEDEVEQVEEDQVAAVEEERELGQAEAAEAAVRQAAAEGLTLQPSDHIAGYRGVGKAGGSKPFQAKVWRASKEVHLGRFATAEEAALAYARTTEAQAQVANPRAPKPVPLTAEEAVAQAAAEGLTLEPGSGATGYKGVHEVGSHYKATVWRAGKLVYLGYFVTAEQAALAVARFDARTDPPAASPAAAKRAAPPPPKPPLAKQPRHTPPPRPAQPVLLPQRDAPAAQASPKLEAAAAAAARAPVTFKHKLALLKRELDIALATPAIPAVAEANTLMGIVPSLGESLGSQLDRLLAIISS
jgi:O6-methylguanine-DNA--protein-cysteine methyltransferase